MKTIYFLNAYHLGWSSWPPGSPGPPEPPDQWPPQPIKSRCSPVQPSPVQSRRAQYIPVQPVILVHVVKSVTQIPFQKPHSLICLVCLTNDIITINHPQKSSTRPKKFSSSSPCSPWRSLAMQTRTQLHTAAVSPLEFLIWILSGSLAPHFPANSLIIAVSAVHF